MDKSQAKQRIEKLKELINYHRYLYHVLDKQEISESALDSLKKELFDLEREFPEFITPESPTQRVGGKPLEKFEKTRHPKPMLSFNDAFSFEDMRDWQERIKKLLIREEADGLDYFCELKFDGLAVELVYKDGVLKVGSTRGDGLVGENITQNLKTIESIPSKLRDKEKLIEDFEKEGLKEVALFAKKNGLKEIVVRGEALISKKEFSKINQKQEKMGLPPYANPRNIAAGSIRQLDPKITASRKLDIYLYDLVSEIGQKTHEDEHKILKSLGFKAHKDVKYCKNLKEVFDYREFWLKKRNSLPFEIDGVVVQVNKNRIFEKLGVVGKTPRGAIAFKFPLKQSQTVVEDIKVQVGRTGAITPVAILKPVEVGGTTITRATLHNEDEIKRLGVKINDTVIVARAGDVIPDVIKVLKELRTGKEKEFRMPKICPICGTNLKKKEKEVVWRCQNSGCLARKKRYFNFFVSRNAFDIEGLGPKIIEKLISVGLISDPADLYTLKEGDLIPIERFAEKSAQNLVGAIQAKKKIDLSKFIYALGIRGVGEETARDLAVFFRNLKDIKKAGVEELLKVKDIGPETAKSIRSFFQSQSNLDFLEKLNKVGIEIVNPKLSTKNQKLRGKTFVLTGGLKSLTRDRARERIREMGGEVSESVSKNIDFVVAGEEPGSKMEKAKKLGVRILSEGEFLKLLK